MLSEWFQHLPVLCAHINVQVGDELPSVECHEGSPATKVNIKELFAGKKGILFAVPGAFTPGCSKVDKSYVYIMESYSEDISCETCQLKERTVHYCSCTCILSLVSVFANTLSSILLKCWFTIIMTIVLYFIW